MVRGTNNNNNNNNNNINIINNYDDYYEDYSNFQTSDYQDTYDQQTLFQSQQILTNPQRPLSIASLQSILSTNPSLVSQFSTGNSQNVNQNLNQNTILSAYIPPTSNPFLPQFVSPSSSQSAQSTYYPQLSNQFPNRAQDLVILPNQTINRDPSSSFR